MLGWTGSVHLAIYAPNSSVPFAAMALARRAFYSSAAWASLMERSVVCCPGDAVHGVPSARERTDWTNVTSGHIAAAASFEWDASGSHLVVNASTSTHWAGALEHPKLVHCEHSKSHLLPPNPSW